MATSPPLAAMLREGIEKNSPRAPAIVMEDREYSWQFVRELISSLENTLDGLGIERYERVGFIAHTRPTHVATLWGLLIAQRCPSMIYGFQSADKLAADIRALRYPLIIADHRDWTDTTIAAAMETGSAGLSLSEDGIAPVPELAVVGQSVCRDNIPGAAVETLSSGTTGKPKRIVLSERNLTSSAVAAVQSIRQMSEGAAEATPAIIMLPLANISGVYATVPAAVAGQPIALLEKFQVTRWLALIQRYRPATADVPPAALSMLLEAGVTPADLPGVRVIRTGAAPLDREVHRIFAEDFGIPINLSYGASEFCGVVTTWTMDELAQFERSKRGSCGRALPGIRLRVIDRDSGEIMPPDGIGLLEAQAERIGTHWIRTSDLVRIDKDGFMWFEGRADATIYRGGFKIAPEAVAEALRAHPGVSDAAVTGEKDERLGEVPVAFIVPADNHSPPEADDLASHARKMLAAYEIPVKFLLIDEIPRTSSMKIDMVALRGMV